MDLQFMINMLPLYGKAFWITINIAFWGSLISIIIGLIANILLYSKIKVLEIITKAYIEISRNTPLLIQIFFLYYGITKFGIKLGETTCAIIGLSFLGGSYMAESLRAGIESVPKSQIEAGLSIGMNKYQLFRYVILPQAFSVSMPLIGANTIFLLKETSIVGAIAIKELMHLTKSLIGIFYKTNESLLLLVLFYLIAILPLSYLFSRLERRLRNV